MKKQLTPALGRSVFLRPPPSSDRQVWADTFTGLYHLPPDSMPTPETVLDLGANIGLTAAHYAHLWPHADVVAVEMDAECCELIGRNAPTVRVRNGAVSAEGGWGTYNPDVLAEAYHFTRWVGEDPESEHGIHTLSRTMPQIILRAFGTDGVDFVKMDVEGTEWELFARGADWAPLVRHLVVELHGPDRSEELVGAAIELLKLVGFQARHHPPHPQSVYAWR